jgi:iron complex transport system substrate-binding protein
MPGRALLARTGVSDIPAVKAKRAYGFTTISITIRGISSAWSIWRKDLPAGLHRLNPDETYHDIVRHFTSLPDLPFVFPGNKVSNPHEFDH